MNELVRLGKRKIKCKDKLYIYWTLRWYGSDGKRLRENIGLVGKMSKGKAEKARQKKITEIGQNPAHRNMDKGCSLSEYLRFYFEARKTELAPSTFYMHEVTGRYLVEFYGASRSIGQITRADARAFKTALASGKLKPQYKKIEALKPASVEKNIRNARTIFGIAAKDDVILFNPFDRLSETVKVDQNWHWISPAEYKQLIAYAKPRLRLIISLCRLAGLRRDEAVNLEWAEIDWAKNRLQIIAKQDGSWQPKDKDSRIVPIDPELQNILLTAYEAAEDGQRCIVTGFTGKLWRDFQTLFNQSGVQRYAKPYHSLRKSCITDWAGKYPMHVVKEWAGHADISTTAKYYLQVSESEFDKAAKVSIWEKQLTEVAGPNWAKTGPKTRVKVKPD